MRLSTSKPLPSAKALAAILSNDFSDQYTYKLFGLGEKSIIVGKSTLIGAQISIRADEITIEGAPPSVAAGILSALGQTELAIVLFPFLFSGWRSLASQQKDFEKEIAVFLKQKYS